VLCFELVVEVVCTGVLSVDEAEKQPHQSASQSESGVAFPHPFKSAFGFTRVHYRG
jgi:hypothetical protein